MLPNQQPETWRRNSDVVENQISPGSNRSTSDKKSNSHKERKRIKVENNNNNEEWSTNDSEKLITSSVTGGLIIKQKMHAVVQTHIPTVTKAIQTKNCEQYDSACQTDSELIESKFCDMTLHRKVPSKNASSQTEDRMLLSNNSNNVTISRIPNSNINEVMNTSAPPVDYLSPREDLYLATFQDLAILNYTIDNLGKQQLALIENTRNPQVKLFLQNVVFNQFYNSLKLTVGTFMRQMIPAEWNVQVNLVCPNQLANNLWRRFETISQSTQITRESFTSVVESSFRNILHQAEKTSIPFTQPQHANLPNTGSLQALGALIDHLNPSTCMNEPPTYAQTIYQRPMPPTMRNNVVPPMINNHNLPFLSASDVMEEIRREESRRNEQLRNC